MKLKLIAMVLLLATLLSAFAGCSPEEETTSGKQEENNDAIPQGYTEIANNKKSAYQIVYPLKGGEAIQGLAEELAGIINDATGANIKVYHDNDVTRSEYEIRIGRLVHDIPAYNEINKEFSKLGNNDFVVSVRDKMIYIYAKENASLKTAINYFKENVLYTDVFQKYAGVKTGFERVYNEALVPEVEYTGKDENYFYFLLNKGTLGESYARLSFTGNKAWRLQTKQKETDEFNDIGASQRLAISLGEKPENTVEPITVKEEGKKITATASDGSSVVFTTDTFGLKFYTPDGELASHITGLSTSSGGSTIVGDLLPNEGVFGTGERFNSVNQRGKNINMFSKDIWSESTACYMVVPLLCFTRGSGIFFNIYEEMNMKLGSRTKLDRADTWSTEVLGANMDCYIYTSDQMSDAIYGYSVLSGFAEMPEEWSYGMIICRYSPDLSQKWTTSISQTNILYEGRGMGVYDTIAKMEAYDLPWSTILAEGWGPYNSGKQDDLKELCDYTHSLGKKFMVYMRVGWAGNSQEGFQEGFLVEMIRPNGTTTTMLPAAESNNPDTGGANNASYPYLDITNPAAVEWFFGEYWDYLSNEIGVDGCKIDFCETLPEYYELNYYDEDQPTSGSHHWYPTAFCAMFWEMISQKPDSGICYTRGGGIGSQRSPYMWAGDQMRNYPGIKFQLIACLSSGMSGVPFMSYDMSGYQYGGSSQNPYNEAHVFVRGLQFTAFSICMQQHGKVRQAFEFADGVIKKQYVGEEGNGGKWQEVIKGVDSNGNPIYEYVIKPGEMTYITDIYRGYVKLHEAMTPYITEYAQLACDTGMPVMRPLALMWQDDVNVYNIDDEYMFGDAFLVAPVLDETYKRDIYLPEGEWVDMNTGVKHTVGAEGKKLTNYAVSLQTLPVFYKVDNASKTVEEILPAMEEIFKYIAAINCAGFVQKEPAL